MLKAINKIALVILFFLLPLTVWAVEGSFNVGLSVSSDGGGGGGGGGSLSIVNVQVVTTTLSTATISWQTDADALCQWYWGTTIDYTSGSASEVSLISNHLTEIVSLSSSTTYHFKIACRDSVGHRAETSDYTFTTKAEEAPSVLTNVIGLYLIEGDRQLQLFWQNPTFPDLSGVSIRRSTLGYPALTTGVEVYNGLGEPATAGEVSFLNTGLTNGTRYYYSVFAYDSAGNFSSGAGVNGVPTSTPVVPPATTTQPDVTDLRIVESDKLLTLFWRNPTNPDFFNIRIRRSTAGYPSLTSGSQVYSGLGNPATGGEVSFANPGLTNGIRYYYSVFAFNDAGRNSSGAGVSGVPFVIPTTTPTTTPPIIPTTTPTTTPPIITLGNFVFSQDGKVSSFSAGGTVNIFADGGQVTVYILADNVPAETNRIVMDVFEGTRVYTYFLTLDGASRSFAAAFAPLPEGRYALNFTLEDSAGQTLIEVNGWLVSALTKPQLPIVSSTLGMINTVQNALAPITAAASSPVGKLAAQAVVGMALVNIALSVPFWNFSILQFLFTQPWLFLFRRRRKDWGTVFNSITKKPVDLALVRLYNVATNRLIVSRVTDKYGRFIFFAQEGKYTIKVEKKGFVYPSEILAGKKSDGQFLDLYFGEEINIPKGSVGTIASNIPIDPDKNNQITDKQAIAKFRKEHLAASLSLAGPIFALVYLFIYPSIFSLLILALHILLLLLFKRLAAKPQGKRSWGKVFDLANRKSLSQAVIRIFSPEYGRMLEFYVTDNRGEYGFLVENNKYYLTASKDGYVQAQTPIIDLTGKTIEEAVVKQDIGLKPGQTELPPAEPTGADTDSEKSQAIEQPITEKAEETVVEAKPAKAPEEKNKEGIFG